MNPVYAFSSDFCKMCKTGISRWFVSLSPNPELRKTLMKIIFRKVLENFRPFAPQFSRIEYAPWSQKCGRNLLCSVGIVRTEKTTISGKPPFNRDLNAMSSDCKSGVLAPSRTSLGYWNPLCDFSLKDCFWNTLSRKVKLSLSTRYLRKIYSAWKT
jgi:hypothetical protein